MSNKLFSSLLFSVATLAIVVPTAQGKVAFTPINIPNPELQAQFPSKQASPGFSPDFSDIPNLNLTEKQKNQLQGMQRIMGNRLTKILNSEQLEDFRTAMQSGDNPRKMMRSLNLSSEQKKDMRKLMIWRRKQLNYILDEDQLEKIEKLQNSRKRRSGNSFSLIRR
ncbi:MAG: hypothetical protein QNJ51_14845 [Calothrix sp. MO_167.B12]|nr:hypothetical protein [Calothrix sp. MO_167.B12]